MRHLNEFDEFNPDDFSEEDFKDLHNLGFKKKFVYGKDFGLTPQFGRSSIPGKKPHLYMSPDMVHTLEAEGILPEPNDKDEKIYSVPSQLYRSNKHYSSRGEYFGGLWPDDEFKSYKLTVRDAKKTGGINPLNHDIDLVNVFITNIKDLGEKSGNFEVTI